MTLLEFHIKFEICQWQPILAEPGAGYCCWWNKWQQEKQTCVWNNRGKYWTKPQKKKKKTIGTDFMALNHPLRTNHEAQVNISKSFEKDILCMVDVAKVQAYWKFHLMWIEWDSNLVSSDDCTQE